MWTRNRQDSRRDDFIGVSSSDEKCCFFRCCRRTELPEMGSHKDAIRSALTSRNFRPGEEIEISCDDRLRLEILKTAAENSRLTLEGCEQNLWPVPHRWGSLQQRVPPNHCTKRCDFYDGGKLRVNLALARHSRLQLPVS